MDTADLLEPEAGEDGRSASELATLLVELGRVTKARRFYPPRDPRLAQVFARGLRTWQVDLERHGALEVELARGTFRALRSGAQVAGHQLGGLAHDFAARALRRARFEPGLDAEAFAGFVELLATEPEAVERAGGSARLLYAQVPAGIVLNGTPPSVDPVERFESAEPSAPADLETAAPQASAGLPSPEPPNEVEPEPDELVFADEAEACAAPGASAEPALQGEAAAPAAAESDSEPELDFESAGAELRPPDEDESVSAEPGPAPRAEDEDSLHLALAEAGVAGAGDEEGEGTPPLELETGTERQEGGSGLSEDEEELRFADDPGRTANVEDSETLELAGPEPATAPVAPAGGRGRAARPAARAGGAPRGPEEAPEAEPSEGRSVELEELLDEMEECEDGPRYADLARRVGRLAERLSEENADGEAYRAMLALGRHASGEAKRERGLVKIVEEQLRSLAVGRRLQHLIDRACAPRESSSVHATQTLLVLGESVVPALLDAAELERDPDRRGQMHGILIAMGEKTLPELLRAMECDDPAFVKSAVRLAGEAQNPGAVPMLASLLGHADAGVREEAARSLVRIGDRRALDALVKALVSPVPGLPALAAHCLGASGSPRAVRPLLGALREATRNGRVELARELIRALGRLGRPEATPDLAGILLQRGFLKRRRQRELKVAAASALGRLPGDDAVGALAQAAQSRDAQIRRAAQIALDRRARALAGRGARPPGVD